MTCLELEKHFNRSRLKHHLDATEDLIEFILAKFRIRLAKIRPGVNIIHHQLEVVAADVVVEAAQDGLEAVVPFLHGIQILRLHYSLQLLRKEEICSGYVEAIRLKVGERRRHSVYGATLDVFLEVFTNEIEWTNFEPGVHTPRCSFICAGEVKRRERTVTVYQ